MILNQHCDELEFLGNRGNQLGVQHQIRAVANHDDSLATGTSNTEASGNLVTHGRESIFNVIAEVVAHAPQLVQVARQRTGSADQNVGCFGCGMNRTDDL